MGTSYDPRFLQGVDYFNQSLFFEAHEVWEDVWMDAEGVPRHFYQGLIQVAVCLHHFGNGNVRGARKLLHRSCHYLSAYGAHYSGIRLDQFVRDLQCCCAAIAGDEEPPPQVRLDPGKVPRIQLDPPPETGAAPASNMT